MADPRPIDQYAPPIRKVHQIKWPGTERVVGLLMLKCDEIMRAEADAREAVVRAGMGIDALVNRDVLDREIEVQQAFRMVVAPDSKGLDKKDRIFKDAKHARETMEPWERTYFLTWHGQFQTDHQETFWWPVDQEEADAKAKAAKEGQG